jgi:hypothetical protein
VKHITRTKATVYSVTLLPRCQGSYEETELPKAKERFLIRFPAIFYVQERLEDEIFTSFPHFAGKEERLSPLPSW